MVRKQQRGYVVGFDPETFEVGYHEITGWYEGPPDRIFEIDSRPGRTVRVTAGHNLFTLDRAAGCKGAHRASSDRARVSPCRADPRSGFARTAVVLLDVIPESEYAFLVCAGPTVRDVFTDGGDDHHAVAARPRLSPRRPLRGT